MKLLLVICAVALFAIAVAEPRLRFSSAEGDLIRRSKELFRKRGGNVWSMPSKSFGFVNLAEKRRVRELFGKRSVIPAMPEYDADLPDDQYQSIDDLMTQLHRERRGRVRELFG